MLGVVLPMLLGVAVVLSAVPDPAVAAEKGIQTDLTWGVTNLDRQRAVQDVQELGAKWMRVTMAWHDIETAPGTYTMLDHYDAAITDADSSGSNLVVTVYGAPEWASGTTDAGSPPLDPQDYANFIRFAAARWGDKVDAWEIWNEENTATFWSTGPNPAGYAALLKAAYPAVKAADPTARVVYGGVSHNDYRFIENSYAAEPNLGDYYDVMATHPYPTPATDAPEHTWLEDDGRLAARSFSSYREVRDVMLANGDDKPIWLTEFGWSTNTLAGSGVTEATQADFYTRAMRCLEQDPYVEVAIWYIYRNHAWANDANTWLDQLGLVRTDFSHKLAYDAFKNYTPGNVGCAYEDPKAATAEPTADPTTQVPVPDAPAPLSAAPVGGPPQLRSPRLSVRQVMIEGGRLVVDGDVAARAAGGTLRLIAWYEGRRQVFAGRIDGDGTIRVRRRLPGSTDTSIASVALVYAPNERFEAQWVVLKTGAQEARLRLRPQARAGMVGTSYRISGALVPDARGRVLTALAYRTADGRRHTRVVRSKIHDGRFERPLRVPAGARNVMLYVVYAGDPERGIAGSSKSLRLR